MGEVTELIANARAGDRLAAEQLYTAIYADLRRLAARQISHQIGDGMHTTSLVHEAYFRLAKPDVVATNDRAHFFAVAGRAMRQLVIDHARKRQAEKRGGGADLQIDHVPEESFAVMRDADAFALEQSLEQLAAIDPALCQLVEMRFYAGLELTEIADITGRSERSLKRDWRKARAFLHAQLSGETPDDSGPPADAGT